MEPLAGVPPIPTRPATRTEAARTRLPALDGIRGVAALFVVVNHVFLRAFPGYPVDHAPAWAAPFIYGRFAVVVFIVLSGFSLALATARDGWRLRSLGEYARRRAWRILPPYWAALAFSLAMTWFVVAQPGWPLPNAKSVGVDAVLVQDVVPAPSPNRAFWSIAIEVQLYLLLPLLVLLARRLGAGAVLAAVAAPVLLLGLAAQDGAPTPAHLVAQYTPDLAVLFAVGVVAAGVATSDAGPRHPWHWYAAALAVPPVTLVVREGSVWTIGHLFWVDMALGPALGCLLVAVATRPAGPLDRLLSAGPLRRLGSFSYSLYLTHAPIVIAVYYGLVQHRVPSGVPTFVLLCATVVPLTVVFARLFAEFFELPFQRRRGWAAVGDALRLTPEYR